MPTDLLAFCCAALVAAVLCTPRARGRHRRAHVRLRFAPYRTDQATAEHVVAMLEGLHRRVSTRWPRRLWAGQPAVALEVHWLVRDGAPSEAVLAVCCAPSLRAGIESAVRTAYPSACLEPYDAPGLVTGAMVRLRKRRSFIHPLALPGTDDEVPRGVERLLTAMSASREACVVQLALTPAPSVVEGYGRWLLGQHERRLSDRRSRGDDRPPRDRSEAEHRSLQAALAVQRRPLFAADIRVAAQTRAGCEAVADALRAEGGENELVVRGFGRASRRLWRLCARGEGEALGAGD
ncbi:MAG: hypothetical protein M3P44_04835, partial [Actinomycetota bacterium]|nr:hypothetical protein [Actinomycetota bacterium]